VHLRRASRTSCETGAQCCTEMQPNLRTGWSPLSVQVLWSYVVGMLTNLGALPIERIHAMLKMFAMTGSTGKECTPQELKRFLDSKVKEERLVFAAGSYRLSK